MYVCMYVCVYVCMYVCMCICTNSSHNAIYTFLASMFGRGIALVNLI